MNKLTLNADLKKGKINFLLIFPFFELHLRSVYSLVSLLIIFY